MWSRFLWVSVYRSAKPECAQLFLWLFLSLIFCAYYYSHNNDNIFQLHFISASQEQSYFALKCMQNSPNKVFNPPLWMEELAHHILSQSICIMGCLIYRVVWCVPTNHLKVLWGQIVSFFKKKMLHYILIIWGVLWYTPLTVEQCAFFPFFCLKSLKW